MKKRSGWNPTRRNRNIGTVKSGHGRDNRDGIPRGWKDDRVFWEVLKSPVKFTHTIHSEEVEFWVEPPTNGFTHAVTPHDVIAALGMIPEEDFWIEKMIFRQPTRKEATHSSVWGRLAYCMNVGRYPGPAVILESMELSEELKWARSLEPFFDRRLEELREDEFEIVETRRDYRIRLSAKSVRTRQLFRTVFHEAGHMVDWMNVLEKTLDVSEAEGDRLIEAYEARPVLQREMFADRYATELRQKLVDEGKVPFNRKYDIEQLQVLGLDPEWFQTGT